MTACKSCRSRVYLGIGHTCADPKCYYHVPMTRPDKPSDGAVARACQRCGAQIYLCIAHTCPTQTVDEISVPRLLTAENGAKAALIGEFSVEGHTIPWATIKLIWRVAIRHFDDRLTRTAEREKEL